MDDEAKTNEHDIEKIQTSNNHKFEARERDCQEEEESSNEESSTNTETSNSNPIP